VALRYAPQSSNPECFSPQHYRFADALQGRVVPGNPLGVDDVMMHNLGFTRDTRLTSWSTVRSIAKRDFADVDGPGGVILETTIEELQARGIRILTSPDKFDEAEILVEGVFGGIPVTPS
jgi:hypothetical protein